MARYKIWIDEEPPFDFEHQDLGSGDLVSADDGRAFKVLRVAGEQDRDGLFHIRATRNLDAHWT